MMANVASWFWARKYVAHHRLSAPATNGGEIHQAEEKQDKDRDHQKQNCLLMGEIQLHSLLLFVVD